MFRASSVALTAAFVALAVALGFMLLAVPNVELVTLTVFLGGAAGGPALGALVGVLAELVFSLLNPIGVPLPLVLIGQLLGMAVAGWCGGVLGGRVLGWSRRRRLPILAAAGVVVTLVFDALTNLGLGVHLGPVGAVLIGGLAFAGLHIVTNGVAFVVLGLPALRVLADLGLVEARR